MNWTWADTSGQAIEVRDGTLVVDTLHFHVNKVVVHDKSQPLLDQLAAFLDRHVDVSVLRIEVHTDSRGLRSYNLRLSAARAEAVARALVERGVACERLQPVGYGELRPIACNQCRPGENLSRRTELHIASFRGVAVMDDIDPAERPIVGDACARERTIVH